MKWLYLLFRPCRHRWQIVRVIKKMEHENDTLPIEQHAILQCKRCGDLKKRIL